MTGDDGHRKPVIDFFMAKPELPDEPEDEIPLHVRFPFVLKKLGHSNFGMRYRVALKIELLVTVEFENGEFDTFIIDDLTE